MKAKCNPIIIVAECGCGKLNLNETKGCHHQTKDIEYDNYIKIGKYNKILKWFKDALTTIQKNDKTVYSYRGKNRGDKYGNKPDDSDRRWLTPSEIAVGYLNLIKELEDSNVNSKMHRMA